MSNSVSFVLPPSELVFILKLFWEEKKWSYKDSNKTKLMLNVFLWIYFAHWPCGMVIERIRVIMPKMFPLDHTIKESRFQKNYYCLNRTEPSVFDLDSEYTPLIPVCDHSVDTNAAVPRSVAVWRLDSRKEGPAVRRGFAFKGRRSVVQSKLCALLGGRGLDLSNPAEFAF